MTGDYNITQHIINQNSGNLILNMPFSTQCTIIYGCVFNAVTSTYTYAITPIIMLYGDLNTQIASIQYYYNQKESTDAGYVEATLDNYKIAIYPLKDTKLQLMVCHIISYI